MSATDTTTSRRRIFEDEHEDFRQSVRRWLTNEVAPHFDDWEREGIVPREVFAAAEDHRVGLDAVAGRDRRRGAAAGRHPPEVAPVDVVLIRAEHELPAVRRQVHERQPRVPVQEIGQGRADRRAVADIALPKLGGRRDPGRLPEAVGLGLQVVENPDSWRERFGEADDDGLRIRRADGDGRRPVRPARG